jgi:DNA-binding MarR family transcriptional regulator
MQSISDGPPDLGRGVHDDPPGDRQASAEDEIVRALRQIMQAVDLHSRRLLEEYGLTGPQLVTLREVQRSGRVAATSLARAIHLSAPTLTGILRRLENRGLLSRSREEKDRRVMRVELTDAGREMLDRAPSPLQETFRQGLGSLDAGERLQVLVTLKRVAAMMQADAIPAVPPLLPETHEGARGGEGEEDPASTAFIPSGGDAAPTQRIGSKAP